LVAYDLQALTVVVWRQ